MARRVVLVVDLGEVQPPLTDKEVLKDYEDRYSPRREEDGDFPQSLWEDLQDYLDDPDRYRFRIEERSY